MAKKCDVCGRSGVTVRHVTRSYGRDSRLFLIENVPVVSCPHCGESYLTADTLQEIERIKLHRRTMTRKRQVPVALFAA